MSRTVISVVVAGVIVALTAIAYFVMSSSFEERARKDSVAQLQRSYQVVQPLQQLQSINVMNRAERLASLPCSQATDDCLQFVQALNLSGVDRSSRATRGFDVIMSQTGTVRPDIIALVDKKGELVAMHEVPGVVPKQWLAPGGPKQVPQGEGKPPKEVAQTIIPALTAVLAHPMIISDVWYHGDKMLKVGVAPIIDAARPAEENLLGALVIAFAQTSKSAQQDKTLLGTEIAYFDANRVVASSFVSGGGEDTARGKELSELLAKGSILSKQEGQLVTIGGTKYLAAAAKLPRGATKELPADYPPVTAGAVVLSPIVPSAEAGTVKLFVLVLGGGALIIAMLGLYLMHRRLVAQIDQVELGVIDIINGNVDRTFRPVGEELEGLSNGLNVMLARLLGRPEPGEEEFDEEGNPIILGRVEFEEGEGEGEAPRAPAPDPDLAALAQESEPDYYKRVYTEYLAAKRATGHPDEVSFENFIAKLKVNEGKLRAQYQCRAVRFRVVTKDGKVSLKPVPIFA